MTHVGKESGFGLACREGRFGGAFEGLLGEFSLRDIFICAPDPDDVTAGVTHRHRNIERPRDVTVGPQVFDGAVLDGLAGAHQFELRFPEFTRAIGGKKSRSVLPMRSCDAQPKDAANDSLTQTKRESRSLT